MKYSRLFLMLLAVMASLSIATFGQDGPPPGGSPDDDRREGRRPNLLAELGLSQAQIQEIRRVNQSRRPAMQEAQRRMREANRALDMAIYQDTVSDEEVQARLKDFQAAQSELLRLRFESELAIRKVLTPEQLVKFRDVRKRFAETREDNMRNRRMRRRGRGVQPGSTPPPVRRPPSI